MRHLLRLMATATERRPGRVLLALFAATLVLGFFSTQQQTDTDMTAFAPEGELADTLELVQREFAAGGVAAQIVFDAGETGDVLDPEVVAFADEVVAALAADDQVAAALAQPHGLSSFAMGVADTGDPVATELLSQDYRAGEGARAGLVVVGFDPDLTLDEVANAELRAAAVVAELEPPDGVEVEPFGQYILNDRMERDSEGEMSSLLGLSFLLIILILALQFRSVSDVVLGLVGLIISITWMFGIGVLLGPDYLGLVGYFTQVSIIVPVLLVGLGVDYSIHLTSRYREERRHGLNAGRSANAAVQTVGGALVLATFATMLGFLTNVISPLPPLGDFGVFTAAGVISAFMVMSLLIPSSRNLLDTRRARRQRSWRTRTAESADPELGLLAKTMSRTSVLAERVPLAVVSVAVVITVLSGLAATQIRTSFSQEDFIPPESDIGQLIAKIDGLFGGDVNEVAFFVVEGELTEPGALDAIAQIGEDLADEELVRSTDGVSQVQSPYTMLRMLADADPALGEELAGLGFGPDGVAPDADVAAIYQLALVAAPAQMSTVVDDGLGLGVVSIATRAGPERAEQLGVVLREAAAPLAAAGLEARVTSELLVIDDTLDALTASQARGIAFTLMAALALLVGYYGFVERRPLIGAITMVPSVAVVAWVLGTMWLLGYSFNVLTAMVASLGIGIGVPFGIHMTHRFLEERRRYDDLDEAVRQALTHTGGAMAGSAATTAAGFGVLVFASLVPIQQFGTIVAITILYSFLAAVFVQPSCLRLWAGWRERKGDVVTLEEDHRVLEPVG